MGARDDDGMARESPAGVTGSEGRDVDADACVGAGGGVVWVVGMGEGESACGDGARIACGSNVSTGKAVGVYAGAAEGCEDTEGDGHGCGV